MRKFQVAELSTNGRETRTCAAPGIRAGPSVSRTGGNKSMVTGSPGSWELGTTDGRDGDLGLSNSFNASAKRHWPWDHGHWAMTAMTKNQETQNRKIVLRWPQLSFNHWNISPFLDQRTSSS